MSGEFPVGRPKPISAAADLKSAPRGLSIGQRLTLIVLAAAVPMLLLTALIVSWLTDRESERRRDAMLYASRAIQSAVDAQLDKYVTVAEMFATLPSLQRDDLAAFRAEAEHALPDLSRYWVVLADAHGQQLVSTFAPAGEPLPRVAPQVRSDEVRAFKTERFQISGVIGASVAKIPVIAVGVPVFRSGEPTSYLMIVVDVTVFRDLLNSQHIPEGWFAAVADRAGNFIVRSRDDKRWVGKAVSAGWRAVMQLDGVFEFRSVDGQLVTHVNTVSPLSGWAIGISQQNGAFEAPVRQTIVIASLMGLAVTLLSMLLAGWAARRITGPIKALAIGARALQRGEPVAFAATGVPEVDHALHAFDTASQALLQHEDQRTQAETALKESEERLRLLLDGTKEYAVFMLDPKGLIVSWNEGARRITGYGAEEIIGRHFSICHSADEIAAGKPERELETALQAGRYEEEGERVKKDGTRFWASVVITPLFGANGKLKGFSNIARDVTRRKQGEEERAALTDRLRATVDTAADAIIVIDECGFVQSVNPAVERIFGYRADEVVGNNVSMLMPEPHRSAHDGYLEAYLWTGVAKIIGIGRELEAQRKDGKVFPVELAVAEWRVAGKRFFTGIVRDITERKQAEEHVRFVMRELSHRTKNVLAVVQSMAWQTARTSIDLEDFAQRFASRVEALACSHDLLTETKWQGVRLENLVRGQLRLFGAEKHLDVHGPDLVLRPEAAQSLGLALHELATNALKYGALTRPAGRIEVGWSIDAENADSRQFRMFWRESGGPEASSPERNGFGRTVIKEMTERALKGEVTLEFRSEGLLWQFTGPVVACLANAADVTY